MPVELYPHQKKAIASLRSGSILKGGTGTGKSITVLGYYMEKEAPKDIYVITTARKRDSLEWESEAIKYFIGTKRGATSAGVLKVDSYNNIANYVGVKDAFFIFDEQRLVGSGSWVKAFIKIARANNWIMLSATPGDVWMDYVAVFVANGYYKNRTEFIRRHVVYNNFSRYPKIDRYVDTAHLNKLRRQVLVEMPYLKHTKMHTTPVAVKYDADIYKRVTKDRWHVFEDRPIKDVSELFSVMRKVVNSDPSRIEAVQKLFKTHPRLIIFYNFNYELEMLRGLSDILKVPVAEWNGHKHEEIPTGESWIYLVQYTAGSEAWNCITTNAVVFYSLNYSYKINEQARGRIDRLNTPYIDLYCYVLRSPSSIDGMIMKSLRHKKNFNEFDHYKEF